MGKDVSWGNTQACGILGLCTVVIPLSALNLGWIPVEGAPIVIPWLLFGGLVQIICGIIDFRRGGLLLATPLVLFGFMLCITPAFGEIVKIWIKSPAPGYLNGVGFLVVAAFVLALLYATGLVSSTVFYLVILLDIGLWLVGLAGLGIVGLAVPGWYLLLIFALGMVYVACAIYLNEVFGRQVLPLGAPIFKPPSATVSG
ncbi:MAG: GPR1/FUN34/YaaH family transporter [Bacillota bacterium]